MTDEFCKVTRKKWISRKTLTGIKQCTNERNKNEADVDVEEFLKKLQSDCLRMEDENYFVRAKSTLTDVMDKLKRNCDDSDVTIKRLVCFGIGSFTTNLQAFHQLAFILNVQKYFHIPEAIYYDPVFRKSEQDILQRLNCAVMPNNCEAKYLADIKTLFYMPHCYNNLTNNLLWRNWSREHLSNIILINNSFETLLLRKPERILILDSNYIVKLKPFTEELTLNDDYKVRDVFNDLSVHIFPWKKLPEKDSDFWIVGEAPTYNDPEMILNAFRELRLSKLRK